MQLRSESGVQALADVLFDEPDAARCLVASDGSIVRVNRQWVQLTGCGLDDGGPPIGLLIATALGGVRAADIRPGTRIPVRRSPVHIRGVDAWWDGAIAALPMENGTGLLVTMRNVGMHTARATPISHQELRLRQIIEGNPTGVVTIDDAGRVVEANAAFLRIVGRTGDDVRAGRVMFEAIARPEWLSRHHQAWADVRENGQSGSYESELTSDERSVPVLISWARLGGTGHQTAFVLDITDRKRAESALRDANRRIDELLAALAHEVPSPDRADTGPESRAPGTTDSQNDSPLTESPRH